VVVVVMVAVVVVSVTVGGAGARWWWYFPNARSNGPKTAPSTNICHIDETSFFKKPTFGLMDQRSEGR